VLRNRAATPVVAGWLEGSAVPARRSVRSGNRITGDFGTLPDNLRELGRLFFLFLVGQIPDKARFAVSLCSGPRRIVPDRCKVSLSDEALFFSA
jgi:hypothetical protein